MTVTVVPVGGVPTQIVRLLSPSPDAVVLVIPGNPGIARLYVPFAQRLATRGEGRLSVAVASHAGHVPGRRAPHGFYALADQRAHHLRFVASLPPAPKVHVVGHSIGAWLALGVLDEIDPSRRGRAVLLFPTIERMAESPAGRRLRPLLRLRRPVTMLSRALRWLPGRDRLLVRMLLSGATDLERPVMLQGLLELSARGLDNVLQLAREELATVSALPEALLARHASRLTLYYGDPDGWILPGMPEGMQARFPAVEVVRCGMGVSHSFVFGGSLTMADFVLSRLDQT